ncbi:MAG: transcription elongation factor GreA [bacterium]|nr:transcription elongation factor GreA [bacterium]
MSPRTAKSPSLTLTRQGASQLKSQLQALKDKRPGLVDRLARARSFGDLSENSEYTNAKEELDFLDNQIQELEAVLQVAKVINNKSNNTAGLGATVVIKNNSRQITMTLVSHWEADPLQKKISIDSPLGQALNGHKKGDTIVVDTPNGPVTYTILEVK